MPQPKQDLPGWCSFCSEGLAGTHGHGEQGLARMLDSRLKPENGICCRSETLENMAAKTQTYALESLGNRWHLGGLCVCAGSSRWGCFLALPTTLIGLSTCTDLANASYGLSRGSLAAQMHSLYPGPSQPLCI